MAGAEITLDQLTAQTSPVGTDLVPLLRTTPLQKVLLSDLKTYFGTGVTTSIAPSGDTTGATDTATIQTALNTGLSIVLGPGVFYTNATLNINTVASHGMGIAGAGPVSTQLTGANKTTIQPTAAVSVAFKIDGTPFAAYIQGIRLDDFAVDMVNMTDASSSVAIQHIQAFGGHITGIKVWNEGTNKRAFQSRTGNFTTTFMNCKGRLGEIIGTSSANAVTTLLFIDHDFSQFNITFGNQIGFIGGTVQGTINKFNLTNTISFYTKGIDVEGTGIYLNLSGINDLMNTASCLDAFAGTLQAGTPTQSSINLDLAYFAYTTAQLSMGGFRLCGQGTTYGSRLWSGGATVKESLEIGRGSSEFRLGVAGVDNDYMPNVFAGDALLQAIGASNTVWIGGPTWGSLQVKPSALRFRPQVDGGGVITLLNNANTELVNFTTSGGNGLLAAVNGTSIAGYSDNFSTQTWALAASNGSLTIRKATIQPLANADAVLYIKNAAGTPYFDFSTLSGGILGVLNGAVMAGYTDNFTTNAWGMDSTSGAIFSYGLGGIGYALGAGGAVTQATSKATGVTLNKTTGAITMAATALAAATSVVFTLTNSTIVAPDMLIVNIKSGATSLAYQVGVEAVAAGSTNIVLRNVSGGSLSEAVVLSFAVFKGVVA